MLSTHSKPHTDNVRPYDQNKSQNVKMKSLRTYHYVHKKKKKELVYRYIVYYHNKTSSCIGY